MAKDFDGEKGLVIADGLDQAFIGLMLRFNVLEPIACYDYDRVIQGFMADGMTEEEAVEYFEFNVIGSWVGDRTPCYLRRMSLDEAVDLASEE
jgi:hypothetical protein